MTKQQSDDTKIALIGQSVVNIESTVNQISRKLENDYVTNDKLALTNDRLLRISQIVYGVIGLILTAVVGAALTFLVNLKR